MHIGTIHDGSNNCPSAADRIIVVPKRWYGSGSITGVPHILRLLEKNGVKPQIVQSIMLAHIVGML